MKFERPEIIRPPSEWRSYFLPLTSGCSNNTCTFCNRWGEKLQMRDLGEVKKEIDALALYMKSGLTLPEMPGLFTPSPGNGTARACFYWTAMPSSILFQN